MRLKAVQAFDTPKDARAITQVCAFIFDIQHTNTKSQLNTPESQLRSLAELRCGKSTIKVSTIKVQQKYD